MWFTPLCETTEEILICNSKKVGDGGSERQKSIKKKNVMHLWKGDVIYWTILLILLF